VKKILVAITVTAALCTVAHAQFATGQSAPLAALAVPADQKGSIIDIGDALGPFLAPYVNALVGTLISALVSWVLLVLKQKFNVSIDEGHRDALVTALQNQAGSLIADGVVRMQGAKITVPDEKLAESANEILAVIPDAAKHLGLTPDYLTKRIVDMIPQTPAGAAMVAAAQPLTVAAPAVAPTPPPPKAAA
jgi:hypothetical protein